MEIISFIYVFALFIIFTPNVFISTSKEFGILLHATLFIIIFYFTYEGVLREGFFEKEINVTGMDYLAELLDNNRSNEDSTTVVINNKIRKPTNDELTSMSDTDDLLRVTFLKMDSLRDDYNTLLQKQTNMSPDIQTISPDIQTVA
jgi:hypothetical protein